MVKLLVGFPGCGKSTYAKTLTDFIVLSSDAIRAELYGSEDVQTNPKQVFGILYERYEKLLKEGKNVVLDATHIKKRDRKQAIEIAKKYNQDIEAIVFTVSVDVCKLRNAQRTRKVPDYVYDRMLGQFEMPTLEEGFSCIISICK